MTVDATAAFWELFRQRQVGLARAASADEPPYDELLECLQRVDPGLYLEFGCDSTGCDLIITAEGEQALFPLVRAVVAAAPTIPGWTIHALKPKTGFPSTVHWHGYALDVAAVVFEPLDRNDSEQLDLHLFVPGLDPKDVSDAHNAALRAMDSGLGEQGLAEAVRGTKVRPLPQGATSEDFIPLVDLDAFIEWRKRKLTGGSP